MACFDRNCPPGHNIRGGQFLSKHHFTKAVFGKVKKLGLSRLYKTNQLFRIWIRKQMALPFLPGEQIRHTYPSFDIPLADLLDSEKELVHKFKSYFNKFWIIGNADLSVFLL